jgi:single-strand DNA-binding protein
MEIIGRVTKDAIVSVTKSEKEVVNFSLAVNMSYRPKGQTEFVQSTTYYNCSFWKTTKIAAAIRKGALLQVTGDLSAGAYIDGAGVAKPDLRFHVNEIKFHSKSTERNIQNIPEEIAEDLPF